MNGLVYDDDGQITDLHCHKRELSAVLNVPDPSAVLSSAHARSTPFVHIIVDYAPDQGGDILIEDIAILEREFIAKTAAKYRSRG